MGSEKRINDQRYIAIGLKVAYYRKLNGLTQEQLAERINMSTRYISKVETLSIAQPVSLKTLFTIADLFKISPDTMLDFRM
ncbi:XRE family transcriptional regulator [Deltaproteobacteria bacterium Smac51]|nr:XRE family transcriptional regulator [Deltaproteobacteria bacterium Smac51]